MTVVGERSGPRVAGILTALPVVAGPIAFFIALEQGAAFAARSAAATLAAVLAVGVFCVLYAGACLRAPWWPSLLAGWSGFAATTWLLERLGPPLPGALALALATPLLVSRLAPQPPLPPRIARVSRAELGARMAAGAALTACVTGAAAGLGPTWSGLLTVFPIATAILAVSSHRSQGPEFSVYLLRGLAAGLYSLTAFFAALAFGLEPLGTARAFALALAAVVAVHLALLRCRRGGATSASAQPSEAGS